jgi:hypothetical protein
MVGALVAVASLLASGVPALAVPAPPRASLLLDGSADYVEVASHPDFSVSPLGLTVSAWVRPDSFAFDPDQGCGYIHWMGKGEPTQHEWAFRMYRVDDSCSNGRSTRVSFYVFNLDDPPPSRGCGSYFQDGLEAGQWFHVVGIADAQAQAVSIYKNGALRHTDSYAGIIAPQPGTAPFRIGTRDLASFFPGAIAQVRVWNRPLNGTEVSDLYTLDRVPAGGLVAQYLLDEGSGSTARDSVGGHHGTVVGSLSWAGPDAGVIHDTEVQSGGGC